VAGLRTVIASLGKPDDAATFPTPDASQQQCERVRWYRPPHRRRDEVATGRGGPRPPFAPSDHPPPAKCPCASQGCQGCQGCHTPKLAPL